MSVIPYYDHDNIKIYLGNSLDILPELGVFDLLLTDPPYGIGRDGRRESKSRQAIGHKGFEFRGWDTARPPKEMFELMFKKTKDQCIWGGNYFCDYLPPKMGWLVWDKGVKLCQSDCELAFTNRDKALRSKTILRFELAKDKTVHPTQKPLSLMLWCLTFFECETVLDPFMGSGTSLLAAKDQRLGAVGIEQDKGYCDLAVERLSQEMLPF